MMFLIAFNGKHQMKFTMDFVIALQASHSLALICMVGGLFVLVHAE